MKGREGGGGWVGTGPGRVLGMGSLDGDVCSMCLVCGGGEGRRKGTGEDAELGSDLGIV